MHRYAWLPGVIGCLALALGCTAPVAGYARIYKKQVDGSWKAAADMFNADMPPPGAMVQ